MHEFGSVKECPKCGNRPAVLGWKRNWQRAREAWNIYLFDSDNLWAQVPARPERVRSTCYTCGYVWYEKPKDAGEEPSMPDPTTPLGWAYQLHEHLTAAEEARQPERAAEHDEQAKTCAARLGRIGEEREGMLRACEDIIVLVRETAGAPIRETAIPALVSLLSVRLDNMVEAVAKAKEGGT